MYRASGGKPRAPVTGSLSQVHAAARPATPLQRSRAITVSCYPATGALPSTILKRARPAIDRMLQTLPAGYSMTIEGEDKEQRSGFGDLAVALGVSVPYHLPGPYGAVPQHRKDRLSSLPQFRSGASVPSPLSHLWGEPSDFMAFLGVASLIGVIVSHIIVLFDRIEEQHDQGAPLLDTLLNASLLRLRPILVTLAAIRLSPSFRLLHMGPAVEALCYAEIGGLLLSGLVDSSSRSDVVCFRRPRFKVDPVECAGPILGTAGLKTRSFDEPVRIERRAF